jgi:hypothetical protein
MHRRKKNGPALGAQTLAMIDLIIDLNESSLDLESSVVAAATMQWHGDPRDGGDYGRISSTTTFEGIISPWFHSASNTFECRQKTMSVVFAGTAPCVENFSEIVELNSANGTASWRPHTGLPCPWISFFCHGQGSDYSAIFPDRSEE